jgi:cytochrome c oxidase accessory protein FixG
MAEANTHTTAGAGAGDEQVAQSLYAKAAKIYPREVHGLFARLRVLGVLGLLGIYYVTPWLRWDGQQALLLDLPARKFHIFFITLWPQDFIYLAALLIIAGLTLFFVTALAGRVWCGYACPQTVWTEAFLWIERKVEGDRMRQQKLDAQPMNARKFGIKAAKHLLWGAFSVWTGFTFVGYFTPIIDLGQRLLTFNLGSWETFWVIFYGFATYGNAGWMREQVCKYMCPYARFQSAMFDKDTLIVSYIETRGEPRGSRKRSADPKALGLGDCIDCTMCVQVCPTGIDIRNGLQYECIACSACIDACDDVMEKNGLRESPHQVHHGKHHGGQTEPPHPHARRDLRRDAGCDHGIVCLVVHHPGRTRARRDP